MLVSGNCGSCAPIWHTGFAKLQMTCVRSRRSCSSFELQIVPLCGSLPLPHPSLFAGLGEPCIRWELLKFKLTNQISASGENCAIRRYVKSFHSDWLDRRTFTHRSLVYGFLRSNAGWKKIRIVLFLYFWQSIYQSNFCSLWIGLARD